MRHTLFSILRPQLLSISQLNVGYYYCIDISFDLLQEAVRTIIEDTSIGKGFRIKAIHGDFTKLEYLKPIYTFDNTVNLFVFTGYTLGNYNEAHIIQCILNGMNDNDYLLLDARLHRLDEWDGKRKLEKDEEEIITKGYSHEKNDRFAFGPVEIATTLKPENIDFGYSVNNQITVIPNALNVITYCSTLAKQIKNYHKDRLELAATTLYSYEELKHWLPTRGFSLVWSKQEKNTGLFLLKKN